jgi:hypothetical protein
VAGVFDDAVGHALKMHAKAIGELMRGLARELMKKGVNF